MHDRCHRTEAQIRTVHHAGVHLHFTISIEHRAGAGVEYRIVFERHNRLTNDIERGRTSRQTHTRGAGGRSQARQSGWQPGLAPIARAAMQNQRPHHVHALAPACL